MIVYNETVIVEEASHLEWLNWMKEVQIPHAMATGCFTSHRILNVMDSPNEGVTYCIQYHANALEDFQRFFNLHIQAYQAAQQQQFENRFVQFSTLMETVD